MRTTRQLLAVFACLMAIFAPATRSPAIAQPPFPATRDSLKWPFRQDSIWNLPLANAAVYAPATIQRATQWGMTVDEDILVLRPSAPLVDVFENFKDWSEEAKQPGARCAAEGAKIASLPIPADYVLPHQANDTPNNAAAILQRDGVTLFQTQPFHRCTAGGIATSHYVFPSANIRSGDGIAGAHGGSGMSSIGGTIRIGELVPGGAIRHALKVNLYGAKNYFCRANEADGKPGFVWPALASDNGACGATAGQGTYRGTNPLVQMGSLLALKPDFDPAALRTEPARMLARALRDYGAYIVDDAAWDVYAFATESGPDGRVVEEFQRRWGFEMTPQSRDNDWSRDMDDLFLNLHVVTNNTAATPGGGALGSPRRAPLAPPFGNAAGIAVTEIMPLGDSLTEGQETAGGHRSYRGALFKKLTAAGAVVDFVGSQQLAPAVGGDAEHEGHGGFTIGPDNSRLCATCGKANVFDNLDGYLNAERDPDVILLCIGVNDMFPDTDASDGIVRPVNPDDAAGKLAALVDDLKRRRPNAKIVIATLVPLRNGFASEAYNAVNARARALANADPADAIHLADLNAAPLIKSTGAGGDYLDDVHLSQSGADKIAEIWFDALVRNKLVNVSRRVFLSTMRKAARTTGEDGRRRTADGR
jgi:lysophospholipase L1-like esterase